MSTRPAGHEAKAEAEARHVTEQLSVYEHEDLNIGVQNIVFSKQPTGYTTEMIVDVYIVNIN